MDWRGQLISVILAFILGVLVAWQGCGSDGKPETITIEKPVPVIEYVDRWKEKPVRYVETKIVTVHDTIYQREIVKRLDTLLKVDTVKIVEAWLSEVNYYDTTVSDVRVRWQNYQNLTENLRIDFTPKVVGNKFALGVHGNVGLISDFQTQYVPMFGVGLHGSIKKTYLSANYGFNGQHFIGVGIGRNIISR